MKYEKQAVSIYICSLKCFSCKIKNYMKTYIINEFRRLKSIKTKKDFVSFVQNSEWIVFNEDKEEVEKLIFVDKENVLISFNGKSKCSHWQFVPFNNSLILDNLREKILFNILAYNADIIVLNIDSTNCYCFLINAKSTNLYNASYEELQWFLIKECNIDILSDLQREKYYEEIKNRKMRQEKLDKLIQKRNNKCLLICSIIIGVVVLAFLIGNGIYNHVEYTKRHPVLYTTESQNKKAIDLGLSVKWASCNIGANTPEESGNYYGWGEPTGQDVFDGKELVGDLNSRFPSRDAETCPPLYITNTKYDIAKVNWGGKWRMPTKKECRELITKCKIYLTELNDKKVAKIIGPNNNYIILPSAGFVDGTSGNWILKDNEYAIYLYTGQLYFNNCYQFNDDNPAAYLFIGETYNDNMDFVRKSKIDCIERYRMLQVRAVCDYDN